MTRNVGLDEISDGRLYCINDMVKADCRDCEGCFACCCGMGDSILLDPLDVCRLTEGLHISFEELLSCHASLHVDDGVVLPALRMTGPDERCTFLSAEGRCSVHPLRPGVCRLFPLGRYYENGSFQYFLQIHECKKENRTKIKVRKWIDTPDSSTYERYITDWHYFVKSLQKIALRDPAGARAKEISMYLLHEFYVKGYGGMERFYGEFYERMEAAAKLLR